MGPVFEGGGGGRLRSRLGRHRVRHGAAVPAVAARVNLAGVPQMSPVEIGPKGVEENQLGISGLPEQEVRKPLLTGRSDEKVDIGNSGLIQVASEELFV